MALTARPTQIMEWFRMGYLWENRFDIWKVTVNKSDNSFYRYYIIKSVISKNHDIVRNLQLKKIIRIIRNRAHAEILWAKFHLTPSYFLQLKVSDDIMVSWNDRFYYVDKLWKITLFIFSPQKCKKKIVRINFDRQGPSRCGNKR